MGRRRSRIGAMLRGGLRRRRPEPERVAPPALRGLGEPPATAADQAGEAELDTLRGELVHELDRLAQGEQGSASFRRIAS